MADIPFTQITYRQWLVGMTINGMLANSDAVSWPPDMLATLATIVADSAITIEATGVSAQAHLKQMAGTRRSVD